MTTQTGGGDGAAPDGGAQDQPRSVPTRPGWWWAQFSTRPLPVEVVQYNRRLVVFIGDDIVDVQAGLIASCWIAPIPGPTVCAAVAGYADAQPLDRAIAENALLSAIRVEREGGV